MNGRMNAPCAPSSASAALGILYQWSGSTFSTLGSFWSLVPALSTMRSEKQTRSANLHCFPNAYQTYWHLKITRRHCLKHRLLPSTLDSPNQNLWLGNWGSIFFLTSTPRSLMRLIQLLGTIGYKAVKMQVFQNRLSSIIDLINSDIACLRNSPTIPSAGPQSWCLPIYLIQTFYHTMIQKLLLKSVYISATFSLPSPALSPTPE